MGAPFELESDRWAEVRRVAVAERHSCSACVGSNPKKCPWNGPYCERCRIQRAEYVAAPINDAGERFDEQIYICGECGWDFHQEYDIDGPIEPAPLDRVGPVLVPTVRPSLWARLRRAWFAFKLDDPQV